MRAMNLMWRRAGARAGAIGMVAALALAVGACGSSDSDDEPDGGGGVEQADVAEKPRSDASAAPAGGSDEEQIKALYNEMLDAFEQQETEKFCSLMSERGRREITGFDRNPGLSCEEEAARIMDADSSGRPDEERPFIASLRVNGDRARGFWKTSRSLRWPVQFIKQDGEWKIHGSFEVRGDG